MASTSSTVGKFAKYGSSTIGSRILPATPRERVGTHGMHSNASFSFAHGSTRTEVARSYSDNRHGDYAHRRFSMNTNGVYNNREVGQIFSSGIDDSASSLSYGSRTSPPSSSLSTQPTTVPTEISMVTRPRHAELTRLQQQTTKPRTTVFRSQSHVTARSQPRHEKSYSRPRYSCDRTSNSASSNNVNSTQLTLVLMGSPMVGKSAIVNQFLFEIFLRDYRSTVEEFNWIEYGYEDSHLGNGGRRRCYSSSNFSFSSSMDSNESERSSIDGNGNCLNSGTAGNSTSNPRILLQIIDSSGSRDFLAMRQLYYKIGDAFMIVYSVKDSLSYAEALLMVREIQQNNNKNVSILLVANKTDLEAAEETTDFDVGFKFRPEILTTFPDPENIDFIRISAKNLYQVKQAFHRLIDDLVQKYGGFGASASSESAGGVSLRRALLQRRRQSIPSRRTVNELGIDAETLERLVRQHDHRTRQCIIC